MNLNLLKMKVKIIEWSWNSIIESFSDEDVTFYLERDGWNDYGYYTSYYLHISSKYTNDNKVALIGQVKILKKAQKVTEYNLIPLGKLENLSLEYCSLGQSLDYYQRISNLESSVKEFILKALNDIIYNPTLKKDFEYEDGYSTSLLRFVDEEGDIFSLAPIILTGDFENLPDEDNLEFDFRTIEMVESAKFNFSSNSISYDWNENYSLPNRIIVLIGKNGSGKTTFLSKLSRVIFSSTTDREKLKKVATISPRGLGFPKIISISYSAFDTFKVPGIKVVELEQIIKEIDLGQGRYIYCGIRNITQELESFLNKLKVETGGYLREKDILNNKYEINILKTTEEINNEFKISLELIFENTIRKALFNSVLNILKEESSFAEIFNINIYDVNNIVLEEIFNDLSTGHKFILHSLISIIRHIEKNSLLLFDEPEIHLHPPLLSVLMKSLRYLLNDRSSYMVVATHSPVVVQETLSRHVFIIKRIGDKIRLFTPEIQTFGENIGIITSHIFGLNSDITDYHEDLNTITNLFQNRKENLEENINEISHLFDGKISIQARAYLMSNLMSKK